MADEAIERLRTIGSQTWWRHFDDRLGLAIEEARRLEAAVPQAPELPVAQPLLADRVMALADVFEALTAADRPYKQPKTLTESLRIMAFMCKDQHLDTELFRYFLHSGLWRTFAERYMQPAQIDGVDVAALEKLLPAAPAVPAAPIAPLAAPTIA